MKLVTTKTADGVHFTGLLSEPEPKTDAIVIHIHGMASSPIENSWYPTFHEQFPKHGYTFLAGQHRGTGSVTVFHKDPDQHPSYGSTFELFEDSVADIDAWVAFTRERGYNRIILQAHSFGPSKVAYYLTQKPADDIIALSLISPVDMLGLTMALGSHETMLKEAQRLAEQGKETQLLSELLDGEIYISAKTYLNLFTPESNANIFCYTDRPHNWSIVNSIAIPVMLVGGTKDEAMNPVAQTPDAFGKLETELRSSPRVSTRIYEGATHDFEDCAGKIVSDLVEFIASE